jgi:hypothetical protein
VKNDRSIGILRFDPYSGLIDTSPTGDFPFEVALPECESRENFDVGDGIPTVTSHVIESEHSV